MAFTSRAASDSTPPRSILRATIASPWRSQSRRWRPTVPLLSMAQSRPGFLFPNFSLYYVRSSVRHMTSKAGKPDRGRDLRLPGLVHDLNNVLQTLLDAADLLASDPKSAEFVAAAILRCVERGQNLTAAIESAEGDAASFESILKGAISFILDSQGASLTKGRKIRFTQSIERGIELRRNWAWDRVLINLFSNAVRAMPEGGTIHVSARRSAQGIEIVVGDEGPGIAPELL